MRSSLLYALAVAGLAAPWAEAGTPVTFTVDDLGPNPWITSNPSLPASMVKLHSTSPDFTDGEVVYAGVFSGQVEDTDLRYNVFCTSLNRNIQIGQRYSMELYSSLLVSPISTGIPRDGGTGGAQITADQKKALDALMTHCLKLTTVGGLISSDHTAQDLIASASANSNQLHTYDASTNPAGMTNEEAAAAQMLIWEIVHEPWQGTNWAEHEAGVSLDQGILQWLDANTGLPFAVNSPIRTDFEELKKCAFAYAAVPEATALLLSFVAACPLIMSRPRARGGREVEGSKGTEVSSGQ